MTSYQINEVFYSIQGEGVRAGTANVFVRFSGCNLTCRLESHGFDCDTEFASGKRVALADLIEWIKTEGGPCRSVILTGGEPGLQVDAALVRALKRDGYLVAIETNGSVAVSERIAPESFDFVTVSPKVAEHAIRQTEADEVRYVRAHGQEIPRTVVRAGAKLISPAFNGLDLDERSLRWCIGLVKANPEWRLSIQQHKGLGVR